MSNLDRVRDSADQPESNRRQFLAGLFAAGAAGLVAGEAGAQTIQGAREDGKRIAAGMRDVAANMEKEAEARERAAQAQILEGMKDAVDEAQTKWPKFTRSQIIARFKQQRPDLPWDKIS